MGQRYGLYVTFACMQALKNRILPFTWLGVGLLYLLMPGINPTGDALGYAGEYLQNAGTGKWLFSPHHLLYGPFGQITYGLIGKYFTHYLHWMQAVNAIAAAGALYLLKRCFEFITKDKPTAFVAMLLAGSAFATLRFATENETYILPLLYSLWGTWFLLCYQNEPKISRLYLGFILLAIAVLFHQIHCWWWLAAVLFFPAGKQKWGAVAVSLGIILIAYFGVAAYQQKTWWTYPFSDAISGTVNLVPGFDNLKFSIINSIRTWVQVHGNIPFFLQEWPWLWIFPALSVGCIGFAIFTKSKKVDNEILQMPLGGLRWLRVALLLQFLWAVYSVGNAEFMVMIPFLLLLSFPSFLWKLRHKLLPAALAILCWNLGAFLIPNAHIKTINYGAELNLIMKIAEQEKPDGIVFIARERIVLENYLSCETPDFQKLFRDAGIQLMDADSLGTKQKLSVYTDIFDYPMPMSRNSMVLNNNFTKPANAALTGSIHTLYGELYIYKLSTEK
jgi:hypothetical protein